ncbi:MAG TPA: Holliday junction resolvase RuvX [Armatimonadota bacterium]
MTVECPDEPSEPLHFPLLGLDISQTKIGLAIAERIDAFPQPLYTYHRLTRARDLAQCQDWVQRYGITGVVIGLPLNMDGTPGPRAQWMRRFTRELQEHIATPIFLQDERLSTVEAEELLLAQGVRRDERAERVDALAAALILQRFLHERHEGTC